MKGGARRRLAGFEKRFFTQKTPLIEFFTANHTKMRTWIYLIVAALLLPFACKDKESPEDWTPNFEGRFRGTYTSKGITPAQNSVASNMILQVSAEAAAPGLLQARFSVASFNFTLAGKAVSATRMEFEEQTYLSGGMASGYLLLSGENQRVEVQLKTSGVNHTEANYFGVRE